MNPETYVSPKTISKALKNGTEDILENDTILEIALAFFIAVFLLSL